MVKPSSRPVPSASAQALLDQFFHNVASDLLPNRPRRREPRALKRRPKPCPLLTDTAHGEYTGFAYGKLIS
ncbi:MAG TPA: hypothetical protein PKK57_05260, partial [Verrucomicrobiota bacterium]|nr:hypothetical protein [Verrucomicrobiota bacterium]HQJ99304.1 hypothetical protein [Verrucomicrobiota bacterium]